MGGEEVGEDLLGLLSWGQGVGEFEEGGFGFVDVEAGGEEDYLQDFWHCLLGGDQPDLRRDL